MTAMVTAEADTSQIKASFTLENSKITCPMAKLPAFTIMETDTRESTRKGKKKVMEYSLSLMATVMKAI